MRDALKWLKIAIFLSSTHMYSYVFTYVFIYSYNVKNFSPLIATFDY